MTQAPGKIGREKGGSRRKTCNPLHWDAKARQVQSKRQHARRRESQKEKELWKTNETK